ncbi:MAG: response regulator [Thermoproteota archaeon]|nr:response regulator [Thermoproteota archaeon]
MFSTGHYKMSSILFALTSISYAEEVLLLLDSTNQGDNSNNSRHDQYNHNGNALSPKEDTKHRNNGDKPLAKLLVVDDDPDIAQVLKLGLLKNRFQVDAFSNPKEALQRFKSNADSYCLVVSDIRMPALSGIQLARKVKEINPNVKVILMTAFEIRDSEFSKVFPSMQVDGFVQKPISIKDLTNKISAVIGRTKRRQGEKEGD